MGYHRAGFDEVVGVDIAPQPNYPFPFVQADALEWMEEWVSSGHERFDVIHASPPCQAYVEGMRAVNVTIGRSDEHLAELIPPTREMLEDWAERFGGVYVIENVEAAPLREPTAKLCGTSFGLPLRRHRRFESNVLLTGPECRHQAFTEKKYWTSDRGVRRPDGSRRYDSLNERRSSVVQVYGQAAERHLWPMAMGIDWMTYDELAEAIPPAYTEHLGRQILAGAPVQLDLLKDEAPPEGRSSTAVAE